MSLKIQTALFRVRQALTELKQYQGKLARITGKPFATRLNKAYPKSALGRKQTRQSIELANNSELLGYGKANVNGQSMRGFYFRATDGSAKGVAWSAAVEVYHAKQLGRDVFFARDSRIGTKVEPESASSRSVDHGRKAWAAEPAESVEPTESEMTEKVGTELIQRALRGLGSGASEKQVAKSLHKSGVKTQDAFLAIKAAKILMADMMKGEAKDTKPMPPLHKWPIKVEKGKTTYTLKDCKVIEKADPPGSGLYEYELIYKGKSAGKYNSQREVISRAQALRGQ